MDTSELFLRSHLILPKTNPSSSHTHTYTNHISYSLNSVGNSFILRWKLFIQKFSKEKFNSEYFCMNYPCFIFVVLSKNKKKYMVPTNRDMNGYREIAV